MDDPRFKHVATDPRFKAIPRKARKVKIDSRFQSMFTDKKFKVKYAVDRRGRKVKQSSSEDLRKYYDLDDKETPAKGRAKKKKQKQENSGKELTTPVASEALTPNTNDIIANSGDSPGGITRESDTEDSDNDESSSSTDVEDFTIDLTAPASEGVVHRWGEMGVSLTPRTPATG